MLTLGGHPLLIPDSRGELAAWLAKHLDPADAAICFPAPALQSDRNALRTRPEAEKGIGIPILNYPQPPRQKLNSLFWPTGAGRWSRGLFLADDDIKKRIVAAAHSYSSASLELKWGDSDNTKTALSTRVYLLEPRPLSGIVLNKQTAGSETLWLLPVVDVRYWWQYAPVDLEVSEGDSWASVIASIGSALGESISAGPVGTRFKNPSPVDLTRRWDNAAVLLDAVAWSIGKRVVRTLAGGVVLQDSDEAEIFHADNLGNLPPVVAGGRFDDSSGGMPENLLVTFRKAIDGVVVPDADVWDVTKGFGEESVASGWSLTVHSSMLADMTGGNSSPDNECTLECLAEAIRDAAQGWFSRKHDFTSVGATDWSISGFDNSVVWEVGSGEHLFQTRIQSLPPNFFAEQQLSEDPGAAQNADGTTTSTTTTPEASACGGRCKWIWDETGQYWTIDTDGCGVATTTSTTSTTPDAGTTTTTGDCDCSTLETTTTTSTSTTPEPDCRCLYPSFCGVTDGDCTYTHCAAEYVRVEVSCTTTTTPDPGTTTTTPDCATTTTEDASQCDTGCDWTYTPEGWRLISNGCSERCPCPSPTGEGELCSDEHTNCIPVGTGSIDCTGGCTWFGVPSLGEWYKTDDTCTDIADCNCLIPSAPPDQCSPLDMPCGSQTTTTPDPLAVCYTTTSTSTTAGVCDGQCVYGWNTAGFWELAEADCGLGSCSCIEPAITGNDDCEVARTPCQGTPTTTTSTTTTTTGDCALGFCGWWCMDHGDGTGRWDLYANCVTASGCGCKDGMTYSDVFTPEITFTLCEPCSPIGAIYNIRCTSDSPTYTNYDPPHLEGCSVTVTSTTPAPNGACCFDAGTNCSDVTESECAANYADGVWIGSGTDCLTSGVCDPATTTPPP